MNCIRTVKYGYSLHVHRGMLGASVDNLNLFTLYKLQGGARVIRLRRPSYYFERAKYLISAPALPLNRRTSASTIKPRRAYDSTFAAAPGRSYHSRLRACARLPSARGSTIRRSLTCCARPESRVFLAVKSHAVANRSIVEIFRAFLR